MSDSVTYGKCSGCNVHFVIEELTHVNHECKGVLFGPSDPFPDIEIVEIAE